jgi:regulator of RNase E activity RraA
MTDAGQIIYARLKTIAGVTAIVGAGDAARIWPHDQPPAERVYPLITYQCAMGDDGDMLNPGAMQLVSERIAISSIAETYDQAKELADAVCGDSTAPALNNQKGTWGGVIVEGCFRDGNQQTVDTLSEAGRQFTIVEDEYLLWYLRAES